MPSPPAFTPRYSSLPARTGGAVLVSDVREDAVVVRTLGETLPVLQVEEWFGQEEFRGGDARDQKIGNQIPECAPFVPVISANTQSRPEGYSRPERNLAVNRSRWDALAEHRRHELTDVAHAVPSQVAAKDAVDCLDRY